MKRKLWKTMLYIIITIIMGGLVLTQQQVIYDSF